MHLKFLQAAGIMYDNDQQPQAFPFERLAPELQKMVIEKYYEDEWVIEIEWEEGKPIYSWKSSSTKAPLSVSRRFYKEMKRALYSSHSGILHHGFQVSTSYLTKDQFELFLSKSTPFDNTIKRISIYASAMNHQYLDMFKQRHPNLETIEVNNLRGIRLIEDLVVDRLQNIDLLEFMEAKHDTILMKDFCMLIEYFGFGIAPFDLSRPGTITVIFYVYAGGLQCRCPLPFCAVKDATMILGIEISKGGAKIQFRSISPQAACHLPRRDAIAHLRMQKARVDHQRKL